MCLCIVVSLGFVLKYDQIISGGNDLICRLLFTCRDVFPVLCLSLGASLAAEPVATCRK